MALCGHDPCKSICAAAVVALDNKATPRKASELNYDFIGVL